jgi:pimeloyl-ACP methyl ester carboxylesterase
MAGGGTMEFISGKNRLFYQIQGEGHPIYILHAMGTDHRSMAAWLEPIFGDLDRFQRIYIDIPAHGKTQIDSSIKSTEAMMNLILDFINESAQGQPFSLLGHSFGGYLAQGILAKRKKQVKGINLIAPALHLKERSLPQKVIKESDTQMLAALSPDIKAAIDTLLVVQSKKNIEAFLKEVQPGRLLADREFLQSNWREEGYFLSASPLEAAGCFQQKALLLLGKQDAICGYLDYFPFINKFPNLTFTILDEAGHLLPIEKRETVQALVKDWVKSLQ